MFLLLQDNRGADAGLFGSGSPEDELAAVLTLELASLAYMEGE